MNNHSILIIDDEAQIRQLLAATMRSEGYKAITAENAAMGQGMAKSHQPDLILLDLGLPDASGHEVLLSLRTWYAKPIIILSVISDEEDIVRALDGGANDYVTKPFRSAELLARIRAALKKQVARENTTEYVSCGLHIDLGRRRVHKSGRELQLTKTEYKMLALFVENEGSVLTHQFILKEIWGVGFQTNTQYLRVFIGTLRKKLEDDPNHPQHIITENGVGYRFL